MTNASTIRRRCLVVMTLVAAIAVGWALPAAAGGRFHDEAPMQVMTKGLTVEQHVERQILLSRRLSRELPAGAREKAIQIPFSADEANALDKGSRWESPLRIGLVKAMAPGIVVSGLDSPRLLSGQVRHTADGGLVWAAVVRAEAGAIRLHVEGMSLPLNAELYVYGGDGQAYGPYTGAGPNSNGDFWTTAIFGGEAILQLRLSGPVSDADLRDVSFKVAEAGLITRKFAGRLFDTSLEPQAVDKASWPCGNESCVIDATCTNVAIANPAKLSMAKMEWISGPYIYTCTGGLITDNNPTQGNFFLTANHCLSKNTAAQNTSFYWRYATSSCNATCPENSGWPLITTGSTVSATNRRGDFTLLRLSSNPPAGSVFLGWSSAPVANTSGTLLYRISNPGFGPQVYSQHSVDTSVGTCTGWPRGQSIYSRDITGAIDGGSSGSPVLNASSQVVGVLSGTCGFSPNDVCNSGPGENNATVDGAFAYFYPTIQPIINP